MYYAGMMMATTHALAGVALAVVVSLFAPEAGTVPLVAAALGGTFPDFDLYAGHRRTLHFPVYYSALAAPAALVAAAAPSTATLSVALFLAAAALHSVSDMFGGGLELKPWLGTSDRAVYDHYHGRWLAPKRWIRYDGAPEDFLVGFALGVPAYVILDGPMALAVGAAVAVSGVYALFRKPMVAVTELLVSALPPSVHSRLPERFVEDFG